MERGNLSNHVAPAIVINAELLAEIKKHKYLPFKKSINVLLNSHLLLQHLFDKGFNIYIICSGSYLKFAEDLEKQLDEYFIPYTRLYVIEDVNELEVLINASHVLGYYFYESIYKPFSSIGKHRKVLNVNEILYDLGG